MKPAIPLLLVAVASLLLIAGCHTPSDQQAEVAQRGAQVMPFNLEQTVHVFEPLEDGGLQKVVVKDPNNTQQIDLIRQHLSEEASKFARGDFSDPAQIHGPDMPGLAQLQAGASRIDIRYAPLPNGGQIRYATQDPAMIHAIHQWFAAQTAEHGHHAMPATQPMHHMEQ